jgi:hypothetical protein
MAVPQKSFVIKYREPGLLGEDRVEWFCQISNLLRCQVSGFRCQEKKDFGIKELRDSRTDRFDL